MPKTAAAKRPNKTQFILSLPDSMPAKDVVAAGKRAGLVFREKYVYRARAADRKRAAGKGTLKGTSPKAGRPRATASPSGVADIPHLDLAYAVGQLISEGRTTEAMVRQFVEDRTSRIAALEAELAALQSGTVPAADSPRPAKAVKKAGRPKTAKAKPRKARKAGTVMIRRDGRTFTTTTKVVEARRAQGQYLGYIRQVPPSEKPKFKAIAAARGVPTAVEALMKRLGKG